MPPHQQPFTFPARPPQSMSPIAEHPSPTSPPPHPFAFRQSQHAPSGSVTEDVAFRGSTAISMTSDYSTPAARDTMQPPTRQLVSPTPGSPSQPGGQMMRHHLPSRLTTPLPIPLEASSAPVPVDNFAAPRMTRLGSGDKTAGVPAAVFIPTYQGRGSSVSDVWQEKSPDGHHKEYSADFGADGRASVDSEESRRRFTMGMQETYAYNNDSDPHSLPMSNTPGGRASTPGGAQGWEASRGEKRKRACRRWGLCLLVLAIIGVAVGVSVGLTRKRTAENSSDKAAASASSSSSNTLPSAITPTTSSFSDRPLPASSSSSVSATPTPTARLSTVSPALETFSTSYVYASAAFTTTVPLTYTIPPSSARETRANGWLQFTQKVVLPNLGTQRGSFTSDLRFRVPPTSQPTGGSAGALKKRHAHRLR